jgi:predicted SprT family Zn-dependent metalloprotease
MTDLPVAQPVIASQAEYVNTVQSTQNQTRFQENENFGICRKCRQIFQRQQGVHDGLVQYYRCERCNASRFEDILLGSCQIS